MPIETTQSLLRASGLPALWAGQRQWRVLETDLGDGRHFLAHWAAWLRDPQRPPLLHHVALAAQAPDIAVLLDTFRTRQLGKISKRTIRTDTPAREGVTARR